MASSDLPSSSGRRPPFNVARAYTKLTDIIAQRKGDKPLVVLLGECHSVPEYILLNMLLLRHVQERYERVAFGYETPYNQLEKMLRIVLPQEVAPLVADMDVDGAMVLTLAQITFDSNAWQFDMCRDRGIKTIFNDAASDPSTETLSMDNAEVRRTARQLNITSDYIDVHEPEGMRIRNHTMVSRAMAYMAQHDVRVFVQQCGAAHIFADQPDGSGVYEDGLHALFTAQGCDVVTASVEINYDRRPDVIMGTIGWVLVQEEDDKGQMDLVMDVARSMSMPLGSVQEIMDRQRTAMRTMVQTTIPAHMTRLEKRFRPA